MITIYNKKDKETALIQYGAGLDNILQYKMCCSYIRDIIQKAQNVYHIGKDCKPDITFIPDHESKIRDKMKIDCDIRIWCMRKAAYDIVDQKGLRDAFRVRKGVWSVYPSCRGAIKHYEKGNPISLDWSSNTCVIIDPPPYDGVTGVDETVHLLERYNAVWRQANRQDEPLTTNQTLSHKYRYLSEFR